MAVKKIRVNESNSYGDVDYYVKRINNSFDYDIGYIKKYVSELESFKNSISAKLDELKTNDDDIYVRNKLEEIDAIVSGLKQSRSLIDTAELNAERFISEPKRRR